MQKVTHEQAYQQMRTILNEKQWRQYLAVEAQQRGSASVVAREAGVSLNTVKRGLAELEAGESYQPGERIRKVGGGKKKVVETDVTLLADLEQELEPKGDPMSLLRWTCKSLDHLVKASRPKDITSRSLPWRRCSMHKASRCTPTRRPSRGNRMWIGMHSLPISTMHARSLNREVPPSSRSIARRRNCLAILRTTGENGKPKESDRCECV